MRRFVVLLRKELRELVTVQTLLPFVIVIVMFVALGQTLSAVGGGGKGARPVTVIDADKTATSRLIITTLGKSGFKVIQPQGGDPALLARTLPRSSGTVVIAIPAGFQAGLAAGKPQTVKTWTVVRSFSFLGNRDPAAVAAAFAAVGQAIATQIAQKAAPNVSPAVLQQPVSLDEMVVVGTREARAPVASVMSFVSQQTTFIPIVLFIVIIFAAQMIATAIATEKENKTLETLLSYPVSRTNIVTSKMVAAGLVALLSAGAYMIGLRQYMSGIDRGLGGALAGGGTAAARAAAASQAAMKALGLTFSAGDYALLGLTLFAGILVALAIAIILGAFAESVKAVQALLTPLMVLLLVPYFLTLFLDLNDLPNIVRIIVLAIPFTYPFITGPALFLGNYALVWFGIFYQLVWFAVFVFIAARIFSTDRVLTMKLSLGRRRAR